MVLRLQLEVGQHVKQSNVLDVSSMKETSRRCLDTGGGEEWSLMLDNFKDFLSEG